MKCKVPVDFHLRLLSDAEKFKLKPNRFFNLLFEGMHEADISGYVIRGPFTKSIQFNLSIENTLIWDGIRFNQTTSEPLGESEYFRAMFFKYLDKPPFERERVIFAATFSNTLEAIENRTALIYNFIKDGHKDHLFLEPWFVGVSPGEAKNYIVGWDRKKDNKCCFRLCHLEYNKTGPDFINAFPLDEIQALEDNFDPFLSYGHEVVVRLTEQGQKQYKKMVTNRPKILQQHDDVYTFQCSLLQAELYFGAFWEEAVILKPDGLKNRITEKVQKMLERYLNQRALL